MANRTAKKGKSDRTKKKGKNTRPASRKGLHVKTWTGLNKDRMEASNSKRFYLKEGTTKPVMFATGPKGFKEFDQHSWREGKQWFYVPCVADEDGEGCPLCEDEDEAIKRVSYRFVAQIYSLKDRQVKVLEGPKTLSTAIFYRYKRGKKTFTKRVFDITKLPTQPVQYTFELSEVDPVRVAGMKWLDLDEYIQEQADRYFNADKSTKSKKKGKSALDDDDDIDDDDDEDEEDEWDDEDEPDDDDDDEDDDDEEDEEEDDEEDDDEDEDEEEDDDDEEEPDEDELLDKDAYPLSELKAYAKECGVKFDKATKDRKKLVRMIIKRRDG